MKAFVRSDFDKLKPAERRRVMDACDAQINRNVMIVLDIFLKMSCLALRGERFGERRLNRYLGNFRRIFKRNIKLVREGRQIQELDAEMVKIFKKDGYPDQFFKMMFEDWDIETGKGATV